MPAPVVIVDEKRFHELLELATTRTRELVADVPDWPVGRSVLAQLDFMRGNVAAGRVATEEELERLQLGVIAVREVEGADAELATWLMELDFAFRRYEELP